MLKPELYKKTVDILYEAYFNDTLEHGSCCACAVGNIVAANCGIKFDILKMWDSSSPHWDDVFSTVGGDQEIRPYNYNGRAKAQIDVTGYTWEQLAAIEKAFESIRQRKNKEDDMFNGLVAVLEVLKQIHEVTDEDAEVNTTRFRTHYKTKALVIDHGF